MTATKHIVFDGSQKANITFDQYPDAAWTDLSPTQTDMGSRRERLEAAQAYYSTVSWMYHCVDLRSSSILEVPWAITRDDDEEVWSSKDRRPPQQLQFLRKLESFLQLTEAALCLAPEAFWFRERNRVRTLELHWHSPLSVEPQWDEDNGLVNFKRKLGRGRTRLFEPEDYVYIPRPNALHETQPGTPPGQAAIAAAGVLHNVDAFAAAFFERGAIKATVLTIEGNPQPSEVLKLERWWKRFFQGIKNAFETAAVRMGVTPVIVGEGMESLHENDLTQEKKEDIAAAFGIPASIAWSGNASGLGGGGVSEQDERHFYDKTIIPDFKLIARHVNEQMLEPMGLHLEPRKNEMTIFQADENERSQAFLHYVNGGLKRSIAAEILGVDLPAGMEYEELDEVSANGDTANGVTPEPDMPPAQVVTSERLQLPPPESEEKRAERGQLRRWYTNRSNPDLADFHARYLSDAEKRAVVADLVEDGDADDSPFPACWRGKTIPDAKASIAAWKEAISLDPSDEEAEREARMPTERRAERNIARSLNGQQQRVLDSGIGDLDAIDVERWAREDLEAALARQSTEDELYDVIRRALIESVDLGTTIAIQQLERAGGLSFDWTLASTESRAWANQYTGELVTGINNTTRRQVRQSVVEWIDNGEPLDALIGEFEPIFGRSRASLIAFTEVTTAFSNGQRESFVAAGVESWQWSTVGDELVCIVCGNLNGTVARIGADFRGFLPDGALSFANQSFDAPPAHPRCRCFLRPFFPD